MFSNTKGTLTSARKNEIHPDDNWKNVAAKTVETVAGNGLWTVHAKGGTGQIPMNP